VREDYRNSCAQPLRVGLCLHTFSDVADNGLHRDELAGLVSKQCGMLLDPRDFAVLAQEPHSYGRFELFRRIQISFENYCVLWVDKLAQ
jgi:hypothetical protein